MSQPLTINTPEGIRIWDAAEMLTTEEDMLLYLNACFEKDDGDGRLICAALGDIARAKGMAQLAREELSAQSNPSFATVLKVIHALGLRLSAVPMPVQKESDQDQVRV